MEKQRIKAIVREAKRASDGEVRSLFFEVYGCTFAGKVTIEIARASIVSACKELLERGSVEAQPAGQEITIMEETLKQILEEMKISNSWLKTIAMAGRPAEGKPEKKNGKKPAEEAPAEKPGTVTFVPGAPDKDGIKHLEEQPAKKAEAEPTVTIEMLREAATKYSAAFGMEDLLKLNTTFGGAKKLSAIDPSAYATLFKEMTARLANENGKKAVTPAEPVITVEQVKAAAGNFAEKCGAPALASLLKTFGADKLTNAKPDARTPLDPSKYAAFLEAVTNL